MEDGLEVFDEVSTTSFSANPENESRKMVIGIRIDSIARKNSIVGFKECGSG